MGKNSHIEVLLLRGEVEQRVHRRKEDVNQLQQVYSRLAQKEEGGLSSPDVQERRLSDEIGATQLGTRAPPRQSRP